MSEVDSPKGQREELFEIFDKWIIGNEGRETTDQSFGLDYGLELLDDWFKAHDAKVHDAALTEAADSVGPAFDGVAQPEDGERGARIAGRGPAVVAITKAIAALRQEGVEQA